MSGVPSENQTELHGNYCLETCPLCDAQYLTEYALWQGLTLPLLAHDIDQRTRRLCEAHGSSKEFESSVVLFGGSLFARIQTIEAHIHLLGIRFFEERILHLYHWEVRSTWEHKNKADLALVLRSSLRVAPACAMPRQVLRNSGHLVIVNLLRTHFDGKAPLVIYARCDEVMPLLTEEIHLEEEEPSFSRGENPSTFVEESTSISNVTSNV